MNVSKRTQRYQVSTYLQTKKHLSFMLGGRNLAGLWCGSFISISLVRPPACIQKNNNASQYLAYLICGPHFSFPLNMSVSYLSGKKKKTLLVPFQSSFPIKSNQAEGRIMYLEKKSEMASEKYDVLAPFHVQLHCI